MLIVVKQLGVALRFFGGSLARLECSCLILVDGLSPTRTSQRSFIPTTVGNLLTQ
jgi:hypothetical protein